MKIYYDSQIFGMQDYGGISRYFYEIIKRLPRSSYQFPSFVHHNEYIGTSMWGEKDNCLSKFKYRNFVYTLINIAINIPTILFTECNIIHPTYYETYYLPLIKNKKLVLTVYDLIHEKLSNKYAKLSDRIIKQKTQLLNRADHVIAISENTKQDIINIYGIDKKKISVIYLGSSLGQWDKKKRLELPPQYILFVGQRWLYKNFINFLKGASLVIKKYPNYHIVSAGGGNFTDEEINVIRELGLEKLIKHVSFKEDRVLSEIYSRASVFVYPSLYEGFGIPILEAFSSHTPIAISNTSCFPEIAKDAAIYFNPEDPKSISLAIEKVISNNKLSNYLIKRGSDRLKYFSWVKAAKQTFDTYKKLSRSDNENNK